MSGNRLAAIAAAVVLSLAATSISALSQNKGLITERALSLDLAMKIADATLAQCRSEGYHTSVHVMDRSGVDKAALRDDGSSTVNFEVSRRKAFTALAFGRPSADLQKNWAQFPPASVIPGDVIGLGGWHTHQGGQRNHWSDRRERGSRWR
jgi:uncharacterized protein GlcG (DUF336 family)